MKRTFLLCLLSTFVISLYAQDDETIEFTDDELISYATVMLWVEGEKERMQDAYNTWIQENDSIEAVKFSEILKASKSGSLDEVDASETEMAAFDNIEAKNEKQQADFKEVFVGKIKDEISVSLYNNLTKALRSDDEIKSRYQTIFDELLTAATTDIEDEAADSEEDS